MGFPRRACHQDVELSVPFRHVPLEVVVGNGAAGEVPAGHHMVRP
jgi:hypothetical protein